MPCWSTTATAPGPTLALAAVALGWLLLRRFLSPAVYIVGLLALFVALVSRSPLFGFFVFTGYLSVEALPLWWRAPPLAITAILSGVCQVGGWPLQEWASWPVLLAVVFINLFIAGAMFAAAEISEERGRQREEMEREAGVMQERQRLAREIHDTIAQDLTGIVGPARGGGAGAARGRRRQRLPRRGDDARARGPDRGAALRARDRPRRARGRAAAGRAGQGRRRLVGAQRRARPRSPPPGRRAPCTPRSR